MHVVLKKLNYTGTIATNIYEATRTAVLAHYCRSYRVTAKE